MSFQTIYTINYDNGRDKIERINFIIYSYLLAGIEYIIHYTYIIVCDWNIKHIWHWKDTET